MTHITNRLRIILIKENKVFEHPSNPEGDTKCGKEGIPHLMHRFNCYDTLCIRKGCNGRI